MPYRPWLLTDLPTTAAGVINQGARDIHAALDTLSSKVNRRIAGTPVLVFGSVGANSCAEATANVTGASQQLVPHASPLQQIGANLVVAAVYVTKQNQVTVRVCNPTGSPITANTVRWQVVCV
jgi:hypothetical protein